MDSGFRRNEVRGGNDGGLAGRGSWRGLEGGEGFGGDYVYEA